MSLLRKLLSCVPALIAGAALLGAPGQAKASFQLRLSDGTNTVTVVDGGAGDSAAATPGMILFSGTVGNFIINVTTGLGDPVLPNTTYRANMHLDNVSVSSVGGGTLTLQLSQTDLSFPDNWGHLYLNSSFGGTTAGTVEAWQVLDLNDGLFAAPGSGEAEVHHGPLSGPSFSSNGTDQTGPYAGGTLFSLNEQVVITHSGTGTTSFNIDSVVTVPAPAGLILGLSSLPMFAGAWWVRRRSTRNLDVAAQA